MFALLLSLIFIRPFISSLAFAYFDLLFSTFLLITISAWIISKGIDFNKIRNAGLPLILFCFALIISTVFSQNKLNSLNELLKYASCISVFLIIPSLDEEKKVLVIRAIVFAGFIISVLALYQYFFGFRHLADYARAYNITDPLTLDYISRRRVFFPFVTPNILAGYLIMIMPLAAIDKSRRWFIIPISAGLLLTRSVGAFLSLFIGLALYFSLKGKIRKKEVLLLAGLLIITCLVIIVRYADLKQHTRPLFSTVMRLNYWKDTLSIIKTYPLSGIGIGNFTIALSRYAHNSFLQVWAETGALGLISLLWLIFICFMTYKKFSKVFSAGIILSSCAFWIHNLVDFTFFLPEVAMTWWIILGLSLL